MTQPSKKLGWLGLQLFSLAISEVFFLSIFTATSVANYIPPEDILVGAGVLAIFWLIPIHLIASLTLQVARRSFGFTIRHAVLVGGFTGLATAAVAIFTNIL